MHFEAAYLRSDILIRFKMAAQQRNFFREKRRFSDFVGCHGHDPWAIAKSMQNLSTLTYLYQSLKSGEDPSSSSWELVAPMSTTKNYKK